MNKSRSSDSLANSDAEPVWSSSSCSSSPLDFTSDDETNPNKLFLISPLEQSSKHSRSSTCKVPRADPFQMHRNKCPAQSHRPILGPSQHLIDGYHTDRSLIASTSYHTKSSDLMSNRIPDVIPSTIALTPEQSFEYRSNNQIDDLNTNRQLIRDRIQRGANSSGTIDQENGENFHLGQEGLFNHDSMAIPLPGIPSGSSRSENSLASSICARFMEMRSLPECIEFVARNRDIIYDVTRIVTHDAPAFRDYDFSQYQIDYSVKDSFNPNFWHDREPIVTTADGNCQYHAVSLGLTGSESYTPEVRLATAVAVIDNRDWFNAMLNLIDRGSVLDLVRTIARNYSWGDETTLKAIAVAINRRIFLYTCNTGKKDYEMVKSLSKAELLDAFKEKKYRGGTGIHTYADPLIHVPANNYIMLFHKSEHFIAVLPSIQQPTMFEPYNPIVPIFD